MHTQVVWITGLDLLADMLLRPRFEEEDLVRLKEIRTGELTEASDDAKTIASWTMDRLYFGDGHPFAHPTDGHDHFHTKRHRR